MNRWVEKLEEALNTAELNPRPSLLGSAPILTRNNVPKSLLPRPNRQDLLRMVIEEWLFISILICAICWTPKWAYLPFALLLGGRLHALGVILHDVTHMPLQRKNLWIRMIEVACGYPIGTTLNAMRYHHLRHHRDVGMKTDPYHKPGEKNIFWWLVGHLRGILLVPMWNLRAPFGILALFIARLRTTYGRLFLQDRSGTDLRHSAEIIEACRAELGLICFQLFLISLFLLFPTETFWCYLIPITLAGVLSAHRVLIEHSHQNITDRSITTILQNTQDSHLNLFGALGLTPRNIGYHIVHHLHPQVALHALPELRNWYRKQLPGNYPPPI